MSHIDIAVVGATGAVGEALVKLLEAREFPVKTLYLLASDRTAGTSLVFNQQTVMVEKLENFDFALAKIALFVATDAVSEQYIPKAQSAGCMVIDNSTVFADSAPLIVPSVNGEILQAEPKFVVNPDSSALLLSTVLKPLLSIGQIEHINIVAMQSVSGLGKRAINELAGQTASLLNGRGAETSVFPKQIAFNLIPAAGEIDETGASASERKLVSQTRRLIGDANLNITATVAQLPVFYSDSLAVNIKFVDQVQLQNVRESWADHEEITLVDSIVSAELVTPVSEVTGKEEIYVSRLRADETVNPSINFWVMADNVRKSAAFNTILLAEELIKSYL